MLRQAPCVLPARPDTARQFRDRRWLDDTRRLVADAGLRADATRNLTHLAELVAAYSDGRTMRSRPTMTLLQQLSGLGRATCQRWLRWLERAGVLLVVEEGTTPRYAPDRLRRGDPNLAREWYLVSPASLSEAPSPPEACTPTASAREVLAGGGEAQVTEDRRSAPDSLSLAPPRWPAQAAEWPSGRLPQRRREQLTAVQALQRHHMVLRRLSARRLRSILRPWFRSRWLPADVLWALERAPDGSGHWHADRVRDPAAWLEHRMAEWLAGDGTPLPPHSAELAARAEAARAEAASEHLRLARRPGVDPAPYAAQVRAVLGYSCARR
jgi:hypothetical protein